VWIDNTFPNLTVDKDTVTSISSWDYNCIAWAAGDTTSWWSYAAGYRWPGADRTPFVESLVAIFAGMSYEICDSSSLEEGFDKIAIYAKAGLWKHASRQLPDGRWTSKLGSDEDIQHTTPDELSGNLYGTVHCIMKKRHT